TPPNLGYICPFWGALPLYFGPSSPILGTFPHFLAVLPFFWGCIPHFWARPQPRGAPLSPSPILGAFSPLLGAHPQLCVHPSPFSSTPPLSLGAPLQFKIRFPFFPPIFCFTPQFSPPFPIPVSPPALLPRHISSLIPILQSLEADDTPDIPSLVRALGGCGTPVCHTLLGDPPPTPTPIPEPWKLLAHLLHPNTTAAERGVVLAPDGSTVALAPLFAGIEVGLKRAAGWPGPVDRPYTALDALYAVTITEALGTSFLMAQVNGTAALGPDGCWDDVDDPQNFTLLGPPSLVPDAVANGAMDGVLLGSRLAEDPIPLSILFRRYYGVDNEITSGWPHSSRRRRDFGALTAVGKLEEEVEAMLRVLRGLSPTRELLEEFGEGEEADIARRAAREFMEVYVGEWVPKVKDGVGAGCWVLGWAVGWV
uniref:Uncharacterized protein n=1 Tax=Pavo cristatus TaxID=9049 RepID=A0A8C9FXW5_PAVCR